MLFPSQPISSDRGKCLTYSRKAIHWAGPDRMDIVSNLKWGMLFLQTCTLGKKRLCTSGDRTNVCISKGNMVTPTIVAHQPCLGNVNTMQKALKECFHLENEGVVLYQQFPNCVPWGATGTGKRDGGQRDYWRSTFICFPSLALFNQSISF